MEGEKNFENFQLHWVASESHQNHHPFLLGVSGLRSCFKWRRQWWWRRRRLTTSVCKIAGTCGRSYLKQVRMKLEKWWFDVNSFFPSLFSVWDPFFESTKHSQLAGAHRRGKLRQFCVVLRSLHCREIVTFCRVLTMMKNYRLTRKSKTELQSIFRLFLLIHSFPFSSSAGSAEWSRSILPTMGKKTRACKSEHREWNW